MSAPGKVAGPPLLDCIAREQAAQMRFYRDALGEG